MGTAESIAFSLRSRGYKVFLDRDDLPPGDTYDEKIGRAVKVSDAGAAIKVLDRSYIDLTTPMGRGFMAMMSAMAEDERLRIVKRTHEGRQIARANGVKMGRKPKLNPHQIKEARQRLAKGEKTRDLARIYAVSRSTISRLAL